MRSFNKIFTIIAIGFAVMTATAQTSAIWDGTANTAWFTSNLLSREFTINTAEELAGLAVIVNDGVNIGGNIRRFDFENTTIKLGANIALNDTAGWQNWDRDNAPDNRWTAIETFRGTFDGNGYVISGMYINPNYGNQGLLKDSQRTIKNIGFFDYSNHGLFKDSQRTIKNIGVVAFCIAGFGGGIAGSSSGEISNCYAVGNLRSGFSGDNRNIDVLVGSNSGTIRNSYAAGNIGGSGVVNSYYYILNTTSINDRGEPRTTTEMQSEEFVIQLNVVAYALSANAWKWNEGGYPTLTNIPATKQGLSDFFGNGDGTEENPYLIMTKELLEGFASFVNTGLDFQDKYLKLGANIQLNDTTFWRNWDNSLVAPANQWVPIGNINFNTGEEFSFKGTFDGAGFVISGVYINSPVNGLNGLFGNVRGTIKNLGVVASYVNSSNAGGLAARLFNGGAIINSYSTGNVRGMGGAGGLVGELYGGEITNTYSTGNVQVLYSVGGLVGSRWSGKVINSFYNSETSGQSDNDGRGTPKTTTEMQREDFVALLNLNAGMLGMNKWLWNEGDYPTLSQELATADPAETPRIKIQPQGKILLAGENHTLSVEAEEVSDGGTLTYQWFRNTQNSTTGATAVGTGANLYLHNISGTHYYFVVITNDNSENFKKPTSINSEIVAVVVKDERFILPNFTYNGTAQTLPPTLQFVKDNETITLTEDVHYETSNYLNNTNAGAASVRIKGLDEYSYIDVVLGFTINQLPVSVNWGATTLEWHGAAQAPTGTSNNADFPVVVSGQRTNVGDNYTATAELINGHNPNINLINPTTPFEITQRTIEIQWENTGPFIYNKMVQVPRAKIETGIERLDTLNLSVANSHSQAGFYTGQQAPIVFIINQVFAQNIFLTNRTIDYEIQQRPLRVRLRDTPTNDTISIILDREFTSEEELEKYLISRLTTLLEYDETDFAIDDYNNKDTPASSLSGNPTVKVRQSQNDQGQNNQRSVSGHHYEVIIETSGITSRNYVPRGKEGIIVSVKGAVSIRKPAKVDNNHGIKFAQNIVSDKAEISVVLPNNERIAEMKVVIYDVAGNVVHSGASTGSATGLSWDLRNTAGRLVANGTYLVVAEVKDRNGKTHRYSARLGVKR